MFTLPNLILAPLQLLCINRAIEFYDQVEVIPIYSTMLIFLNMLCGAVILDEYLMYTSDELITLFVCLVVCVIGITMLVKKPKLHLWFSRCPCKQKKNENYFKVKTNEYQSDQLNFESIRTLSSLKSFDGDNEITTKTGSECFSPTIPFAEIQYRCCQNFKNMNCPCIQSTITAFN